MVCGVWCMVKSGWTDKSRDILLVCAVGAESVEQRTTVIQSIDTFGLDGLAGW